MHTPDLAAQVAAARAYEALFVPALFQQWAPRVAEAAGPLRDLRVLDIGCGTGVLAREVRRRTGADGSVVGLDPSPGMLAVARELGPEVEWRQGTAEDLPFADASFDVLVSQFVPMFVDLGRALPEMLRVLKPNGRLVFAVWDSVEHVPAYTDLIDLLERLAGTPAANALRAPFVLGDPRRLVEACNAARVGSVTVATIPGLAVFPSVRVMVEAELRGWLPVMNVDLAEDTVQRILEAAEHTLAPYKTADGRVLFGMPAHLVTACRSA